MVNVVGRVVRGEVGEGEMWSRQVELLLRLGPLCESLLSFTSQDCLKLGFYLQRLPLITLCVNFVVTADKIKAIVQANSTSGEGPHKSAVSSEEDEGNSQCDTTV